MNSPKTLRPRALAHRGVVMARGLWIGTPTPENLARTRALALWESGARVWKVAGGLFLLWPRPRRLETGRAPGVVLLEENGAFWAAPLAPGERRGVEVARGSVVLVRGGEILPILPLEEEDLASWLDLSAWEVAPVEGLGLPPAPPILAVPEAQFAARDKLQVGAAPDLTELLERLREVKAADLANGKPQKPGGVWERLAWQWNGLRAGWGDAMSGLLRLPERATTRPMQPADAKKLAGRDFARLWLVVWAFSSNWRLGLFALLFFCGLWVLNRGWLANLLGIGGGRAVGVGGAGAEPSPRTPRGPKGVPKDSWRAKLMARFLLMSRLARVVGRREARFIGKMLEMFERGDLEAALRHAIPLGNENSGELVPGWGTPSARDNLQIQTDAGPSRPMWLQVEGLEEILRRHYRAAFEKLRDAGENEKAAFVLAELLRENEEAVAFLEAEGEVQLAAELAEARGLSAALVVRQWLVAKNLARALAVARRNGAFAQAVEWLEKRGQTELSHVLRLHWANERAGAGDFVGALEICAPLWAKNEGVQTLAREWVERARNLGGTSRAHALRWSLLQRGFEDDFTPIRAEIAEILAQNAPEAAPERRVFTHRLAIGPPAGPETAFLARLGARALLRDAAAGQTETDANELRGLVALSGDASLKADWPPFSQGAMQWNEPVRLKLSAGRGPHPIFDVAALPGGRFLLALGEVGARLVAGDGRTLAHWEQPTHALAVSQSGGRAILIARRGQTQRLSCLDLATRKLEFWCDARLGSWADTFDGGSWWVSFGGDISLVDALPKTPGPPQILWQTREVAERVVRIAFRAGSCHLLAWGQNSAGEDRFQIWGLAVHAAANTPRLNRRLYLNLKTPSPICAITHDGEAVFFTNPKPKDEAQPILADEEANFGLEWLPEKRDLQIPLNAAAYPSGVWPGVGWTAAGAREEAGSQLFVLQEMEIRAEIAAPGAQFLRPRFTQFRGEEILALGDDCGRLLRLDLKTGQAREIALEI